MKTLYHGSKDIIEHPRYGAGKPYNDYGLGFYCTESLDLAKEWAVSVDRGGFANCYEFDCADLAILDLNGEDYGLLHWLALLLRFREFDASGPLALEAKQYLLENFAIDLAPYDAIVGYRADDSYFSFAQDFISGAISYQQLGRAMHLGRLGAEERARLRPAALHRLRGGLARRVVRAQDEPRPGGAPRVFGRGAKPAPARRSVHNDHHGRGNGGRR